MENLFIDLVDSDESSESDASDVSIEIINVIPPKNEKIEIQNNNDSKKKK
jgi:hypothetical protein